jgi:Flp pilus assembly protein TadG
MGGRDGVRLMVDEAGQSLVEFALILPVLCLILLGLAEFGRAFYYTTAIANSARVGAEYAAKNAGAGATATTIAYHVCNETGFVDYSPTASCPGMSVTVVPSPPVAGGSEITVTVTYNLKLISSYLVVRVIATNPTCQPVPGDPCVTLRAEATYPVLR